MIGGGGNNIIGGGNNIGNNVGNWGINNRPGGDGWSQYHGGGNWHDNWHNCNHWYNNDWWRNRGWNYPYYPNYNYWGWAAWPAVTGWVDYGWQEPVSYNYGDNVYDQGDQVYYGDQPVATGEGIGDVANGRVRLIGAFRRKAVRGKILAAPDPHCGWTWAGGASAGVTTVSAGCGSTGTDGGTVPR